MSLYSYEPLDPLAKTIRLMRLLPGSSDDRICVSLETVLLDPASDQIPEYEALSYTWGSPEHPIYIEIKADHRTTRLTKKRRSWRVTKTKPRAFLAVTQRLAEALFYLRLKDRTRTLWIDAVCVDQNNLIERGYQVQRMADIYRNAYRVVIWIGSASHDSAMAMNCITTLSSRIIVDWNLFELKSSSHEDSHLADLSIFLSYNMTTWRSIYSLLRRPWFKRLWIWQEVVLAKTAEIHCGHEVLDWNAFRKAVFCMVVNHRNIASGSMPGFQEVLSHTGNLVSQQANTRDFRTMLQDTKDCICTDPRDRIYGLLNLHSDSQHLIGFKPSYTQKPRDIYKDVVLRFLASKGELNFLASCERRADIVEKPSWVPDWSKASESNGMNIYGPCPGSRAKANQVRQDVLSVTGIYQSEIASVVTDMMFEETLLHHSVPKVKDLVELIQTLAKHLKLNDTYVNGSPMIDSFCRTLCMNDFAESFVRLPISSNSPSLAKSLAYVKNLLQQYLKSAIESHDIDRKYLRNIWSWLDGRRFIITKDGHIGLAPKTVKLGDHVCIILGCHTPLILQANPNGSYDVVGDCYVHGLIEGKAVLGPLPSEWQYAKNFVEGIGYLRGYNNRETGDQLFEDPRLRQLPPGWKLNNPVDNADWNNWFVNEETDQRLVWPQDPRMTAEALSARGVPLREFLLE